MYPNYKECSLWRTAFESVSVSSNEESTKKRLIVAFEQFREGAIILAEEIPRDLPNLTDHSVRHLDALWHIASVIAGPDYPISPLEVFVLGCSILLHDLANSIVALPNRIDDLKGNEWNDQIVNCFLTIYSRRPTIDELTNPPEEIRTKVVFARLRDIHASAAQSLAIRGFVSYNKSNENVYLLQDNELRDAFGDLIGRIANSHHWSIQRVEDEFASFKVGGVAWHAWDMDALKVACLLRCADATHLDMHRASTLQMILREPTGESYKHWNFQNRLHAPTLNIETQELEFRSTKPFGRNDREAWWLAFDILSNWTDGEIRASNKILRRSGRKSFSAYGVAGVDNPENLSNYIETHEWEPVDIAVRITDVASVIERFGGKQLYGKDFKAPLRELIANAADAVRARRNLPDGGLDEQQGQIIVRLGQDSDGFWLEVEDEGIGMSEAVLRGPLLDFGNSFWGSSLAIHQFPGLISSNFRPTGKFGIGFFSVFMLGAQVKVTTRRYDAAKSDTKVLEITRGLKYPMLRHPDSKLKEEVVPRGGTRVRIRLDNNPWAKDGLISEVSSEQNIDDDQKLSHLRKLVSRLAPTLDVDLWVEIGGDTPKRIHVIHTGDWQTIEFDQLLERIGDVKETRYQRYTNYICEPRENGQLLGRFRLTSDRVRNIMSIGGFSASWGSNFLEGIILGEYPQLDRTNGSIILSNDKFVEELQRTVDAGFLPGHPTSPALANYLLENGIVPKGLTCFSTKEEDFDLDGLSAWAENIEIGDAIFLVENDSFEFEDELGDSNSHTILEMWNRLDFIESNFVLALGNNRIPILSPIDWNPYSDKKNTLLKLAIVTICRSWGVELDDIEYDVDDEHQIASFELRDGSEFPVKVKCFYMVRPDRCLVGISEEPSEEDIF